MKSKKNHSRQRKLSFNKMTVAKDLFDVEPPTRIAYSGIEQMGRIKCTIANRTDILAVGYGDSVDEALLDAARVFNREVVEEARVALYGNDDDRHAMEFAKAAIEQKGP